MILGSLVLIFRRIFFHVSQARLGLGILGIDRRYGQRSFQLLANGLRTFVPYLLLSLSQTVQYRANEPLPLHPPLYVGQTLNKN